MTLRLSEKMDADLDALAAAQGISKHQVVVNAIDDYLERKSHRAEYDEAFDRMMKRHAGVIELLRET